VWVLKSVLLPVIQLLQARLHLAWLPLSVTELE
jgi:hypothetical protein